MNCSLNVQRKFIIISIHIITVIILIQKNKIDINCPIHGIFHQLPEKHLAGKGCQICNGGCLYTKDTYIKLAIQVHGNSYCYNNIVYVNQKTKISILCNKCNNYFNLLRIAYNENVIEKLKRYFKIV